MKLTYLCIGIVAACGMTLSSCSDNYKERVAILECNVSKDAVDLEYEPSETQTIDITSKETWKVSVDQGSGDWLTVSPMDGTGDGTLNITATKNSNDAKRSAVITVSAKGAEVKTVTITQAAFPGLMYDFADLTGWQKTGLVSGINPFSIEDNAECEDGKALKIYTRAGTEYMGTYGDRFKVQTGTRFYSGRYEWRVFVPVMGMNDRSSIGAFIYFDDQHELDFEICSGQESDRIARNAEPDDMLCLVSSQANPFFSEKSLIKGNAWHTFVLDLKNEDGKYMGEWLVDGISLKKQLLNYGEDDATFRVLCSMENLMGMGDHAATQENYGLFDSFVYIPHEDSQAPLLEGQLPPEPDGETLRWDFDDNTVPAIDWSNNGGIFTDGWIDLSSGNLTYVKDGGEVGAGKYTWKINVPSLGVGTQWVSGGSIDVSNVSAERSFSMYVFAGKESDRAACTVTPTSAQMLVRCYTESMGVFGVPIDPGEHVLSIDLRLSKGKYSPAWIVDGKAVKTFDTWYTPEAFQFKFALKTRSGGGWMGDTPVVGIPTVKYDYVEYKKYEY